MVLPLHSFREFCRQKNNASSLSKGVANFSANNVNLSDVRLKTDIVPAGTYWDKIKEIQIVTFKYKGQGDDFKNLGVIAQQVQSVAPELIDTTGFGDTPAGEDPYLAVYRTDLQYATLKALQEAMKRIESLEQEIAHIKGILQTRPE